MTGQPRPSVSIRPGGGAALPVGVATEALALMWFLWLFLSAAWNYNVCAHLN